MRIKNTILLIASIILFNPQYMDFAYAEKILLKSGKTIEGKIIKKTDVYIKVESNGEGRFYYLDEVERIDPEEPDTEEKTGVVIEKAKEPDEHFKKGEEYLLNNKYKEAIKELEESLKINPEYAFTYNNLGSAYYFLGSFDAAIENYQQAIKLDPFLPEAYNNLGIIYTSQNKFQEAMDIYQQAIKLNPNYSEAHYNLGSLYRMKGKPEEAITCFKKAIQINPDYAEAYAGLGVAEYALRDYQRAKSNLQKAKELFQKSGDKESLQLVQDYLKIIP